MKVKTCRLYDKGALIRDFVLVKNAAGLIGYYDLIRREFYPCSHHQGIASADLVFSNEINSTEVTER